jgi:hydrogenase maturation protease
MGQPARQPPSHPPARIAVVGLGNVLMGDDAFGPYVVQILEAGYAFPRDVAVLDLGTPGLDLTSHLTGLEHLILVDTVRSEGRPGDLRTYRRAEILGHSPSPRRSPHDPGLAEALLIVELEGRGPRGVLLVGVIPESAQGRLGLSRAVRQSIPGAVREVLRELDRLGAPASPRAHPRPPSIWWEETPVAE